MDTNSKIEVQPLVGVSESVPQKERSATLIENFTIDRVTGGWDNRIGYEKYFPAEELYGPFDSDARVHSLYNWSTHQGARQFLLFESTTKGDATSKLKYVVGNPESVVTLESGRNQPTLDEAVTDFAPFGRFLIILNGHDTPYKFDGQQLTRLGWDKIPNAPTPWTPDSDMAGDQDEQGFPCVPGDYPYDNWFGLGSKTGSAINTYRWKVSFVNEAGSESPLSGASNPVTWTTAPTTVNNYQYETKRQAVYLEGIPLGPSGTVARKLYRTANLGDGYVQDELYYYAGTIYNNVETWYTDSLPDHSLGSLAPSDSDSIVFPAPGARFAANFKSCLFVDGGRADPTRLYYSTALQPDTFSGFNYFDVGAREGGDITALIPYYNSLLIFREKSIEIVRGDPSSGFTISPFQQGVGTRATHTITHIPELGVVFLSADGVWLISGGWDGGSTMKVQRISDDILETLERINLDLIARSVATYSDKWKEWHCYFAADGEDRPDLGIVLHLEKMAWTTRPNWPVGAITVNANGDIIFGNHTGNTAQNPGDDRECGLFVVSRKRNFGYTVEVNLQDEYTVDGGAPTAKYQSKWHDFGYPNMKKHVKYVYLYVVTEGNNTVPITYYKDYSTAGTTATANKMQRAEFTDQDVYGTAKWGTGEWTKGLVTEIRYPVADKACSHFSFDIETTNDIILMGYALEVVLDNAKTRGGKR